MVLTFRRLGVVASIALVLALPLHAQRGFGIGRAQSGGPRPMLFGFALECSGCTRERPNDESMLPVWHYTEYPRVVAVAPGGAAERAGIRAGDVLMAVDGMSILSSDGARRFSAARLVDDVRLTLDRGGKAIDVDLSPRLGRGFAMRGERPLREPVPREYSGIVGDVIVDATSNEPVVATTDSSGTLTLRIGGTVVRVQPSPLFKSSKSAKLDKPKSKPNKSP
jgi:membrane-associated protease RseP (regulator of RpoE activity)